MKQILGSAFITLMLFSNAGMFRALAASNDRSAFARPTIVRAITQGYSPKIAADVDGTLYVVFEEFQKGSRQDVFCLQSSNNGLSWTAPVNISHTSGVSAHPDVSVENNGAVDVVWTDTRAGEKTPDIFFARSEDKGKTWTHPVDISNTPGMSSDPAVAVGQDNSIHVVWTDTSKGEKNKDIYYTWSTDGGKKWAKDPLLPAEDISNSPGTSTEPAIAVDQDGIVHAVWLDSSVGETHPDIFYVSRDNGVWCKPINVSHSPRMSDHPTIGCGAKGKVYVSWLDYSQKPTAPDIWCAIGDKRGEFEKPINISNTPGVSGEPTLAANASGVVAFVWADTSKTFSRPDIFARISNDSANDFTTVMDISNTPDISRHPDVVIAGKNMVVIWEDVERNFSALKMTSMSLDNLATGPATQVDPTIQGESSNSR